VDVVRVGQDLCCACCGSIGRMFSCVFEVEFGNTTEEAGLDGVLDAQFGNGEYVALGRDGREGGDE
jgi:hypothetical protein